jgi:ribosome modulation factor
MNPYDAGYNARLRGVLIQDNPWDYTTSEHAEWNRGWRQASQDDETTEASDPF